MEVILMSSEILVLYYLLRIFIVGFTCSDLPSPKHTSYIYFIKFPGNSFLELSMKIIMKIRGQLSWK